LPQITQIFADLAVKICIISGKTALYRIYLKSTVIFLKFNTKGLKLTREALRRKKNAYPKK
jgi:hypothetical protein